MVEGVDPLKSMACLHAIASDCAQKRVLGDDVAIEVDAYDEMNIKIPIERIATQNQQLGHGGVVCLVGVQSNQFPRAMAIRGDSAPKASRSRSAAFTSAAASRC